MTEAPAPLPATRLRWRCTASDLPFADTTEVEPIDGVVGQEDAVEALRFGLEIDAPGQHVFVRGLVGTGRLSLVRNHLRSLETRRPQALDRVFVHNFQAPDRPRLITLRRGAGRAFVTAMERLVDYLKSDLARALKGDALKEDIARIEKEADAALRELADPLQARLNAQGLALVFQRTEQGGTRPVVVPMLDGHPAPPDRVEAALEAGLVTEDELEKRNAIAQGFAEDVGLFAAHAAALSASHREKLQDATRERARGILESIAAPVKRRFPPATDYLEQVVEDVVMHRLAEEDDQSWLRMYAVNLVSTHDEDTTRPVIVDNSTTLQSLLGTIDPVVLPDGSADAPHMALHAGTLVRADGGTLILDARDLASTPGAWKALTRTLRSGTVELTPGDPEVTTRRQPGLKPDPIPVDVKVVLLGEAGVYYALDSADPDFPHLFKVLVDFGDTLPRDASGQAMVAGVLSRIVRDEDLPPLKASAVAALLEHSARIAAQPDALTARFGRVADIAREAVWVARHRDCTCVEGVDVVEAVRRTKARAGRPGRLFRDRVKRGILRIETTGSSVGQINGLATMSAGQLTYGFPARITATVGPGSQGTINIEGEAELSGAIHTKAFHILGGCLRTLLQTDHPLVFDASIAFEQSYGGIDGDSASGAEVCALISALSRVPLAQNLAMTGAIDQKGNIQPVGAVNE